MIAARLGGIASVQLTHRLVVFRRANPGGGLTRNRLGQACDPASGQGPSVRALIRYVRGIM